MTGLPTLVTHYGIWTSPVSHINVHGIKVMCRSQCDSMGGVAAVTQVGTVPMGLITPATGL